MHEYPIPIDKMPYDDRSYSTPELDYSTPEKNPACPLRMDIRSTPSMVQS